MPPLDGLVKMNASHRSPGQQCLAGRFSVLFPSLQDPLSDLPTRPPLTALPSCSRRAAEENMKRFYQRRCRNLPYLPNLVQFLFLKTEVFTIWQWRNSVMLRAPPAHVQDLQYSDL